MARTGIPFQHFLPFSLPFLVFCFCSFSAKESSIYAGGLAEKIVLPTFLKKSLTDDFPVFRFFLCQMILSAIEALNGKNGSNKSTISKHIESTYGNLAPAHSTLLTHHLNRMKVTGQLIMIKNNYMKPDPNAPPRRGRGRPAKPKPALPPGYVPPPPRPRGLPPKITDPLAPPAPPKKKTPPSSTGSGRKRGRPPKVKPAVAATVGA